jgi:hypothetical protein
MQTLKFVFTCIFSLLLLKQVYGQSESTGFYVVLDRKKECTNPFKSLAIVTIPVCLSKNPIVTKDDFENISKIHVDSIQATKYVNLKISKESFARFQLLGKKLPKTTLALVIDGTIVGIIENLQLIGNPIPIYSNIHSSDIEWVYENLLKLKIPDKL